MIAVYEIGVIGLVQSDRQNGMHDVFRNCNLLRTLHVNNEVLDTICFKKWPKLGRVFLVDQSAIRCQIGRGLDLRSVDWLTPQTSDQATRERHNPPLSESWTGISRQKQWYQSYEDDLPPCSSQLVDSSQLYSY